MGEDLVAGRTFPDLELPDHAGNLRQLSQLAADDPVLLHFYRGWWCPKEQAYFRNLVALQDEAEVAYTRFVSVSVDAPEVEAAFRAGIGARWIFLSDADRQWIDRLGLMEGTDTSHRPYLPTMFTLGPDLSIHRVYNGYWFWGRATNEELRRDFRDISQAAFGLGAPPGMTWLWFDLCADSPSGVMASAPVSDADGAPSGALCAWSSDQDRPTPTAAKIDSRAIDPAGEPGSVSLVLAPDGLYLPFDDPAVAHATRMVLAMFPAEVFSTLVDGDDRFRGSLTGIHADSGRLHYDPFGVLFPAVVLRVEAGILGRMPSPVGPVIQRYGATNPWPWDRFDPD